MSEKGPGGEKQLEGLEVPPNGATDMTVALFYAGHIDNPCEVEIAPGQRANIRDFYIREVERILPLLKNPFAKEMLENKIKQYNT